MEMKIAIVDNRTSKKVQAMTVDYEYLVDRNRKPVITPETMSEFDAFPKAKKDDTKDVGGFICGELKGNRRKQNCVVCRTALTLDADHIGDDNAIFMDAVKKEFEGIRFFMYSTHKHRTESPRYRIVVPFDRDTSAEEYAAVAKMVASKIGMDYFDDTTYEVNRIVFWSSKSIDAEFVFEEQDGEECSNLDPQKYLDMYADWRDISQWPKSSRQDESIKSEAQTVADPLTKDGIVGVFCRAYPIREAITTFLKEVYAETPNGDRYDYIPADSSAGVVIYEDKFSYSFHASDPASCRLMNAFDLVRIHKFPHNSENKSFEMMAEYACNDPKVKALIAEEKRQSIINDFKEDSVDELTEASDISEAGEESEVSKATPKAAAKVDDAWMSQLEYDHKTLNIKGNLKNLLTILENDPNLSGIADNTLSHRREVIKPVPWTMPSNTWRDADDAQLLSYLDENYCSFSEKTYQIAIKKVADDRRFNPILDYLNSLPEWDGIDRVDRLFIDYLGADDNAYVRAVTRKMLCAAVTRVLHPGTKFDTMVVLSGPQGIGKNTLVAKLGRQWFSDCIKMSNVGDKSSAENLQGFWIIEFGELAGLKKAEVETLRSFLSRQNDIFREAYGRHSESHPRQCIFFGTTNAENGYLRDTTGNRRFWPVSTTGKCKKKSWDISDFEIDQIWAEVLELVNAGESLILRELFPTLSTT